MGSRYRVTPVGRYMTLLIFLNIKPRLVFKLCNIGYLTSLLTRLLSVKEGVVPTKPQSNLFLYH